MITEDYVSFEVAKLLKEKGFDGVLPFIYVDTEKSDREVHLTDTLCNYNDGHIKDVISAPTHQMAMRWLREVHNINIDIVSIWNKVRWEYQIIIITPKTAAKTYIHKTIYKKREQACEAAIKYCLENLI